jgi:hypothetical protein
MAASESAARHRCFRQRVVRFLVSILRSRFPCRRGATSVMFVGAVALVALPVSRSEGQRVLNVVAPDTSTDAPPTVPAGLTTIRLTIKGRVKREVVVHRVPEGTNPAELARGAAGRTERWFEQWSFGGPAAPRDSLSDAMATLDLRPARYVIVAYVVDSAGRPRGDKYVWRSVTAIAASVLIPVRFALPDISIRIHDSNIVALGSVRTGQHVVQVENAGARPHELMIARLKPGKTVDDVRRWDRDRADVPPFVYVGGLTPMSSGVKAQMRLVLQTGEHVVLCTLRHAGARERDYQRGVMASFKVN